MEFQSPQDQAFATGISEAEQLAGYRNVSVSAVLSLLAGLASPLAFVGPLLIAVPILGIALALFALKRISSGDGALVGRPAAIAGLSLAIIWLVAAETCHFMTGHLLFQQAQAVAEQWFASLQSGRASEAMQLSGVSSTSGTSSDDRLERFINRPEVHELLSLGDEADVQLERNLWWEYLGKRQHLLKQRYRVTYKDADDQPATFFVQLTLERSQLARDAMPVWQISSSGEDLPTSPVAGND